MIPGLTLDQFVAVLHNHVSPTAPIQSAEHLFGRASQMQQVQQALYAPGRSVFIHGDRGVGKTSLAQTVAYSHQSASREPVLLACDPHSTFLGIMANALEQLTGVQSKRTTTTSYNLKVGLKGVGLDAGRTQQREDAAAAAPQNLNQIVSALLAVGHERKNEKTVVVIDEFDRILGDGERSQFADFIKQIGDQRIPIHFVFCGVAESLEKLLGAHGSCYRYVEGVELRTLNWDARFEIMDYVANAIGVQIPDRPRWRIAAISDGFPHYIHKMCEQLFWAMFSDPLPCVEPTLDHYRTAVARSVVGIEQHLKHTYEQAVMKKDPLEYEQVLWALADHSDLIRNTEPVYDSYLRITQTFGLDTPAKRLDRSTFVGRLNTLKGESSGRILSSPRRGYYQFRESIMRGYVRLRAEEQDCELALDYAAPSNRDPELTWRVPSARRGRMGTSSQDRRKMEYPD